MNHLIIFSFLIFCFAASSSYGKVLPAIPLVVKTPYLSTWVSTPENSLQGGWPTFWTGATKGFAGLIRVDGKSYEFLGSPNQNDIGTNLVAKQTGLQVTPTQSIFTLMAGEVELTINFFTPIDPTDLRLMSIPASYFYVTAKSLDRKQHSVQVYFDISAEWVGGNSAEDVIWLFNKLNSTLVNFDISLQNQQLLQEFQDQSEWGVIKFFTDSNVQYEAGADVEVRSTFVKTGVLPNKVDKMFRRINDHFPVFAFSRNLGNVGEQTTAKAWYGIGHVRRPGIGFIQGPKNQLWEDYFNQDPDQMIEFFFNDKDNAYSRALALDKKVLSDAASEGASYQAIVSGALRQAFAGTELVGTKEKPWYMVKEISSDGNCQTADVIYPHFPVLYYLNPSIIKLMLDPLIDNQEKGFYPHKFAMHDLGASYPRCIGHLDGKDEWMEVEESANMIIMAAAYIKATKDTNWMKEHYGIFKQWASYLVDNGLFTGNALTTDDFLGKLKNSTNLSIKAIIGIAGMSQIASSIGNTQDASSYLKTAQSYIKTWEKYAQDSSGKHLKAGYNDDGSWFLMYNMFMDKLLGTNLIESRIFQEQDAWYIQHANKYGIPLISTKPVTKSDWEMLTAGASDNKQVKNLLYDSYARWLRETNSRQPMPDAVDTNNGDSFFINRPVVGSIFGPLALKSNKQ